MKKTKILLHVTEITGAIILSGLAPVAFLSISEYKFGRFPPVLCFSSRAVGFYTICVPLCVIIACGMILAITTFWILHKVSKCTIYLHLWLKLFRSAGT